MDEIVEFDIPHDKSVNIIKVIGVGGGGSNAVKNMYRQGVYNVSFAICNTDSQALARADIPVRIQLGKVGLGVGGNPLKGKEAAEESIDEVKHLFDGDTKMVFVTAGMGGGTGTGAGPVIAGVAKEMGLLTVGVVTIPFAFEKKVRIQKALQGVEEMRKNVDALLVINNERLMDIYADGTTTVKQAFSKADDILTVATKSIAEIITIEGEVNRDFCDVQTVMKDGGGAIMSIGRANGEHRIEKAILDALNSPLLNNVDIEKARKLLYIIYSCEKSPVVISELSEVDDFMDGLSPDIEVLWGLYPDNTLEDDVKVAIIATGFDDECLGQVSSEDRIDVAKQERLDALMKQYYGERKTRKKNLVKEHENDSCGDIANVATGKMANIESVDTEPVGNDAQATLENDTERTVPLLERLKKKLETFMDETM